jgi:hypothetical protein
MADAFNIYVTSSTFSVTRLSDNQVLLSNSYNYLNYDPSGAIKWPVSPTMSSINGNLTWQFNNLQIVVANTHYAAGAKAFDTYMVPLAALQSVAVQSDTFTDIEISNIESPVSSV